MKALNQRLAEGDADAFAQWYDAMSGAVYHYLLTQTGTSHDASDILQETFVRLYRHRDKLRRITNLRAYTFRVARNEWARWLQQRQREVPRVEMEPWFEPEGKAANDDVLCFEELQQALRQLQDDYREVIELKVFGQLTFQEIADILQKPPGTIATWYRRALEQLQRKIQFRMRDE